MIDQRAAIRAIRERIAVAALGGFSISARHWDRCQVAGIVGRGADASPLPQMRNAALSVGWR